MKPDAVKNFWRTLPRPFFALAPMADVTDAAFRLMFTRYGKPDIMFTEFVSSDGLCSAGRANLLRELRYDESERPIVAQIWGRNPDKFEEAARLIRSMGFDGVDINMGCPQKKEIAARTCAALIREPEQARAIIISTIRGAEGLPVSVKTRIGYDRDELDKWLPVLLDTSVATVTLHARTKKDMSKVPARWEAVERAVKIRDRLGSRALIIGNGDISSLDEAKRRIDETGADGVMVGRGVFGKPWFFSNVSAEGFPLEKKLYAMIEHAEIFLKLFGTGKNFSTMKKHFRAYASGFPLASALREKLMAASDMREVKTAVEDFLQTKTA